MPGVTRVGDSHNSGDDRDPSVLQAGSPDVFVNGRAAGRVGDAYANGHSISSGAAHVFINGRAAARIGDAVSCGGTVTGGSGSVIIGDFGGAAATDMLYRRAANELAGKDLTLEDQTILCLPSETASMAEGEEEPNGWLYLSGMLKKWISLRANADPWRREISPFYVSMDWILSKSTGQSAFADLSSRIANDAALEALGGNIAKQIKDGALPDGGGQWMPFDFINADPHDIRALHNQYSTATYYNYFFHPSLEMFAAMGNFTLRGLAAGQYQVINGNINIKFENAAAVVLDTFNFDGSDLLGSWNCAADATLLMHSITLYDYSFREFSRRHGYGGDFLVVSEPRQLDNFTPIEFTYSGGN